MKRSTLILIILCVSSVAALAQYTFPIYGKTADDFSSAFGPRNQGSAEYPNTGYDYDFHAAIDIVADNGTNVYPVYDGEVIRNEPNFGQNSFIDVLHEDFAGEFRVRYLHITPNSQLTVGTPVYEGSTVLGTIYDYLPTGSTAGDHLDVRYYPFGEILTDGAHSNAQNAGLILRPDTDTNYPVFVNQQGDVIQWGDPGTVLDTYVDNGTSHSNPSGRKYFTFGVRVLDDELDLKEVSVYLLGEDDGVYYGSNVLLYNQNDYQAVEFYFPEKVVYYDTDVYNNYQTYRIAVGDRFNQQLITDAGHNSTSVGLYPRMFASTHDYHTVYFRWYVDDYYWSQMSSVMASISATDWSGNTVEITSIPVVSCICDPPPGAPATPTLITATYSPQDTAAYLEWNLVQNTDFYRIYRCPSWRAMTNGDVIGITAQTEYYDDDPMLTPDSSYKYAVAAVNVNGESQNSNEKTMTFGQSNLVVTITGPSHIYHPGKFDPPNQYTWNMGRSGGAVPYTQVWKIQYTAGGSWYQLGTNTSYSMTLYYDGGGTWTDPFTLKAELTDKLGNFTSTTKVVTEHGSGGIDPKIEGLEQIALVVPEEFGLAQNYPNPFNPETEISFALPEISTVRLTVVDVLGREILNLKDGQMSPGYHRVKWTGKDSNGGNVGSGVYFYRIVATGQSGKQFTKVLKMVLTK